MHSGHGLVRVARCERGEVEVEIVFDPRPDYGRRKAAIRSLGKLGLRVDCCGQQRRRHLLQSRLHPAEPFIGARVAVASDRLEPLGQRVEGVLDRRQPLLGGRTGVGPGSLGGATSSGCLRHARTQGAAQVLTEGVDPRFEVVLKAADGGLDRTGDRWLVDEQRTDLGQRAFDVGDGVSEGVDLAGQLLVTGAELLGLRSRCLQCSTESPGARIHAGAYGGQVGAQRPEVGPKSTELCP